MPEDRSNIATGSGRIPAKGSKKSSSKPASAKGRFDWGDGKGKVHSIPLSQHKRNVEAKRNYGLGPDTPLDAPLTAQQAWGMAQANADRTYAPQIQAAQQLRSNSTPWFNEYVQRVGAQQQAAQAYAQPLLQQAQTGVTNAAQTTPGLDPNSPQAQKDAQAAQGRAALAQLGADALGTAATAANTYFGGLQTTAQRELPQLLAGYGQQIGQLRSQREGAVNQEYGQIRQGEQNASIARSTLGLNTAKAAADAAYDEASLTQRETEARQKRRDKAADVNQYGVPNSEWRGMSTAERQKTIKDFKASGGKSQAEKDAEKQREKDRKNRAAIKKTVGKAKTEVSDIISDWKSYIGKQTDDTSKPKDPVTGQYPARKLGPADIKSILASGEHKYSPGMIHVALLVRAGKPLDRAAIDYLKSRDPNMRIPREWLKGTKRSGPASTNRPAPPRNATGPYSQNRPT